MERLLYVGPDLIFNFLQRHEGEENGYHVTVKAGPVKFSAVVSFKLVDTNPPTKAECTMCLAIGSVAGPPVGIEQLNKAINCLTVNKSAAATVCCEAFINGFLDSEF